jgi:hypothetical protein
VIADEYDGVLLVDQDNRARVQADALPAPSPDGRAFINLFGFDDPAPGVKVYERERLGWRTFTIPAGAPCGVRWTGPRAFQFTEKIGRWDAPRERVVTVRREEKGWRRSPPAVLANR